MGDNWVIKVIAGAIALIAITIVERSFKIESVEDDSDKAEQYLQQEVRDLRQRVRALEDALTKFIVIQRYEGREENP